MVINRWIPEENRDELFEHTRELRESRLLDKLESAKKLDEIGRDLENTMERGRNLLTRRMKDNRRSK